MLDLEIQVRNTGTKTLEDVFIVLEISSSLYPSEGLRKVDGAARLLKVEHVADPIDGKEMTRVTYRVDSIHPQVTMVMKDFLLLRNSSRIRSDVPVTTKDGGRGKVRWEAIIGYELVVTVMARDIPAIRRDLQLFSFDLNDPLVADVSQAENALARLRELGSTGTPVSATLFVLRRPEYPAKGVPVELERLVARCRLDKAERWDVSYFSELGYLPITVTSYR
jgi:hypothetical protein